MRQAQRAEARMARYRRLMSLHERRGSISTAEFCRKHGISEWTFYIWRRKLGMAPGSGRAPSRDGSLPRQRFVPVRVEPSPGSVAAATELIFPGGIVSRFGREVERQTVASVVAAMRGEGCSA